MNLKPKLKPRFFQLNRLPVLAVFALALFAVVGGRHVDDPVPRLSADAVLGVGAAGQIMFATYFYARLGEISHVSLPLMKIIIVKYIDVIQGL